MSYQITGTLIEKGDTEQPTTSFRKREFVLEVVDNRGSKSYTDHIKFQLIQDRVDLVDPYKLGEELEVWFDVKGNRWERDGRVQYFTNLTAWKIQRTEQHLTGPEVASDEYQDTGDDLPF